MQKTRGERVLLKTTGWDEPLAHEVSDEPLPSLDANQVLVEVEACGVCYRDLIDRAGRFPFQRVPITPGHEAAGRVVAVGSGTSTFRVGDRVGTMHRDACGACPSCLLGETSLCEGAAWVFGILADGAYARHVVAPESALYPLPEELTSVEAAVLHCTFGTAYRDLVTLGSLRAGERVLVAGANGGVGSAALQIASRLGAEVVAVIRDERHRAYVTSLGAHDVVVSGGGAFHGDPKVGRVDLALEAVGAPTFASTMRTLRIGGRMVVVGNVTHEKVGVNLGYIITNGLTIRGGSGATRADMSALLALAARVPFTIPIDRTLPLRAAEEAQRLVRAGGLEGRVVLVPETAP